MNKKEMNKIIAVGLTTSMAISPLTKTNIVKANEVESDYNDALDNIEINDNEVKDEACLEEVEHDTSMVAPPLVEVDSIEIDKVESDYNDTLNGEDDNNDEEINHNKESNNDNLEQDIHISEVEHDTNVVMPSFVERNIVEANEIKGDINNISDNEEPNNNEVKEQVYLSEIGHDTSLSSPGHGGILNNTSPSGGKIKLLVDGEVTEFDKGIGAHATSTVVYNISQYANTYTRFVSYIGIDNRQSGRGNGVEFIISTSDDGVSWTEVKNLGVVQSSQESVYVDIKLNGAKYIKLYAGDNGGNGNDHSVYADAKLVKDDYTLSNNKIDGLYPLSYYDEILSQESVEENIENNQMVILQRAFVERVGYETLQRISNKGQKYVDGIEYLLSDETALRYFIANGPVTKNGSYTRCVMAFSELLETYKAELEDASNDNFNLRLAVSISLAYSKEDMVTFWIKSNTGNSPVKRYEAFKELVVSGNMDEGGNTNDYTKWSTQQFIDLPIPMMKWVVDTRMNDDEFMWLSDYVLSQKEEGNNYSDAYNYITYTDGYNYDNPEFFKEENREKYNNTYNFNQYYDDYGQEGIYRLWMIFEEGAVCGGLTQTYSNISEILGRPSSPCGQPGHAAAVTWGWNRENNRYEWMIQNDISGWVETGNQYDDRMLGWGNNWNSWHNASYVVLATDAIYQEDDSYMKATMLNLLANSYSDVEDKREIYSKALSHQQINYDSMVGLIDSYKNDDSATGEDYFELAKKIISTYTYYPQVMMDLLDKVESNISDSNQIAQVDLLKHEALIKASKATVDDTSSVPACTQLANHYLGKKTGELATFSFNGENANKIVINEKYADSQIRIRYSLNGGADWEYTDDKVIPLTDEQLKSITADNNIIVGLVGTETTYTIDILEGKTVSQDTVYANDNENLLIGKLDNLEFSLDGGQTWCDYVSEKNAKNIEFEVDSEGCIRFNGNKDVKVRYKAYDTYLQGNEFEYKFTQNSDTEDRKYVQLKNVSLVDCSAPNSNNHKGEHLIDGTPNTGYHTTFGHFMQDKFYTVKFDKVRFINSIEYLPGGGNNGKLRSGKILTSLDGNTWTESGTFNNLNSDASLKTINLDESTACKYLKIAATETYGNNSGEENMYLSGRMLNFYEDTTKEYNAAPTINYSNTNPTNQDVTATITLPEGCNPVGETSYTFDKNGTHTFMYIDANGLEKSIDAKVTWIDKEAPSANVVYDINSWTSENVTARLVDASEEITILNDENTVVSRSGLDYHVFKDNGSYTFKFKDKAGNIGTTTATVSWIDKTKPSTVTEFENKTENGKETVVVSLNINPDEVEVLNNDGKAEYTFTENGTFVFKLRLRSTGYEFEVPVTVDWLEKEQDDNTTQKPDNNTGSTGGSNNSSGNDSSNNGSSNNNGTNNNGSNNNGSSNNGTTDDTEKPQTGDTMMESVTLFGLSLTGLLTLNRKKKADKK